MAFDPSTAVAADDDTQDTLNPRLSVPGTAARRPAPPPDLSAMPAAGRTPATPDANTGPTAAPTGQQVGQDVQAPTRPAMAGFDPATAVPEGGGPDNVILADVATQIDPDKAARAEALSKKYGIPFKAVLDSLPKVEQKAKADAVSEQLIVSPAVADHFRRNTTTAVQGHDDLKNLGEIERTFTGTLGDVGVVAGKAVVGLPEAAVGLLDIVSGGYVGKGLEMAGVRFKDTQDFLDTLYSPAQQRANNSVKEAKGFVDTLAAMVTNPSTIATTVGQSLPQMVGGAVIGRGLLAAVPKLAPWLAAALGEGVVGAGATAESLRQADSEGLLGVKETVAALGSGAGTALFGAAGGKLANRLGVGDIDTAFVQAGAGKAAGLTDDVAAGLVRMGADKPTAAAAAAGFVKDVAKAGISEGVFEEFPQSVQEQMWQNWATNRPLSEGVGKAAAQGLLAGLSMGSGYHALQATVERLSRDTSDGVKAIQAGQTLTEALNASAVSALRERNPEAFHGLVTELSKGAQVWVDAEVLNQLPPEVLAKLEGVAAEMPAALAANTPVPVNVADILTHTAGTPQADEIVQNARATFDAPTVAEAAIATQQAADYWQNESDRLIADASNGAELRASSERVRTNIAEQIAATGRHRPKVAEAMSQWASAFFTTMGARHGMTAEEMFQRYPLRVLAQAGVQQAGSTLVDQQVGDQTQTPEFQNWFGGSKAVEMVGGTGSRDAVWAPQRMYHTTRNAFDTFEIGRPTVNSGTFGDWETSRHAVFVTPDVDASQAYGTSGSKFATGANVMPLYVKAENPLDLTEGVSEKVAQRLIEAGMSERFVYSRGLGDWGMFDDEAGKEIVDFIKKAGYDSVIFNDQNPDTGDTFESWALFAPEQIKSAIGNRGTFDPNSANILEQSTNPSYDLQAEALRTTVTAAGGTVADVLQIDQLIDAANVRTITLQDLVGMDIFPTIADRTGAASLFTGIDSSQLNVAVPLLGGPLFPLRESNAQAGVVWANRGKEVTSQKAAKLKAGANYMMVLLGDADMHQSNSTTAAAVMGTLEAWQRDGRITAAQIDALGDLVRTTPERSPPPRPLPENATPAQIRAAQGLARVNAYLEGFPGFDDPTVMHAYMDGISFDARKRIIELLATKQAQALGAPPMNQILDGLREPSLAGHRWGDGVLLVEVNQEDAQVELGTQGTQPHPDFPLGIKGKVVGRLDAAINWQTLWQDWLKENTGPSPRRAFELAKPIVSVTQELVDRIGKIENKNVANARTARLASDFAADNWAVTGVPVNQGGASPQEFVDAILTSAARPVMSEYSLEQVKQGAKDGSFKAFQLGADGRIFFGLKYGDPGYAADYGVNPDLFGPNEVALVSVINNEQGARGVAAPAAVLKALQEGATVLDCFSVTSDKLPGGFLPTLYKQFGFKEVARVAFDPQYYSPQKLADAVKFWQDTTPGYNPEVHGYPPLVIMKWQGTDEQRTDIVNRYLRHGPTGLLSGGASVAVREHAAEFLSHDRAGVDGAEAPADAQRVAGDQGDRIGLAVASRARGTVQGVAELNEGELANLGLTVDDRSAARRALGRPDPSDAVAARAGVLEQSVKQGRIRRSIDELVAAAQSQADWRTWYERHEQTLVDVFGDDAPLFQKILSATSQATGVKGNVTLALKAYDQLLSGDPFTGYLPAVIKNLERIRDDLALEGAKIGQYGEANEGNVDAIAVDRHIAMLFFNTKIPSKRQIESAKVRIRKIADRLGWEPRQVQAALWAFNQVRLGTDPAKVESYDKVIEARLEVINELRARHGRGEGRGIQPGGATAAGDQEGRGVAGDRSGGLQAGGLAPLEGAPTVAGASGPDARLVAVAEAYARSVGINLRRQGEYAKVDPERAARIAAAYEAMQHAPGKPAVRAAYADLINQTMAQYRALTDAGYRFYFFDETNDPYQGNPWNAMRDLRANQRMGVFATEAGFGSSDLNVDDNPLLADTGLRWPTPDGRMKRVLANDLFRAVHDAFGHGLEGAGFRAQGEENAWQAHVRLFTGAAVGAITSETRGQNSWLNYGPHGEANRTAKVEDTVFADQKTGLMPEWTWTEGRVGDMPGTDMLEQGARGTFNPSTLELVLNPNANLSTWFHETGHFYLEVMADLASKPDAPQQVKDDWQSMLDWFGVTNAQWQGMTLDEQRPYHERWAESIEQYVMEGNAPSVELAGVMRRFSAWMKSVYTSIRQFIARTPGADTTPLNENIRAVMDRMLATDEQIQQANEVAGMLPDEAADAEAAERLRKRSMADLKFTVRARDKAIKALTKEGQDTLKAIRAEVEAELAASAESADGGIGAAFAAAARLAELEAEHEADPFAADMNTAAVADAFGFETVDAMHREIRNAGDKKAFVDKIAEQRMLEEHGDLVGDDNIKQAANEAVHNAARARSLASELRTQGEMLGRRADAGTTNAKGVRQTVSVLAEAAKQFGERLMGRTPIADLKAAAWKHTAAERRASKKHIEMTMAGKTQEAVQAKQDQVLNNAAAKAAIDGQAEAKTIIAFLKKVAKGGNAAVVEKGRDPDVVNAARAVLMAYGLETPVTKSAATYLATVKSNDPETWAALDPMIEEATQNAQPLESMTLDELRGLHEQIEGMWFLAKAMRQMDVNGDKMDVDEAAEELHARMTVLGIPATVPGDAGALTTRDRAVRKIQYATSALRRVEQWAEGMGDEFKKYIFQPIKDAADKYRSDRAKMRKKFQALVDNVAPEIHKGEIAAPELGYTFGKDTGVGQADLLHAVLHTGNESNKRKLLLGRGWATQNPDGTMDTSKWDDFIQRMVDEGKLTKEHFDFAQGVWDLMEETKAGAQKTHREVFGRYFDEVSADAFVDPFGVTRRGGYIPATSDPELETDANVRALRDQENQSMQFSFPEPGKGFTKSRVEYNSKLKLDLRALPKHLDQVLLFTHMTPAVRGVSRLLRKSSINGPLGRINPTVVDGMLLPWLARSALQQVETPARGDGGISKFFSGMRRRSGAALMFANISNTVQQITGFALAAVKVKPSNLMSAAGAYLKSPKQLADSVATMSPYMDNRLKDEVSAMNDALEDILLKPSVYARVQAWSQRNAYFMQSAVDSVMSTIVWTGAYNEAVQDGKPDDEAIKYADGVVRQTQGSTLPEDVSRIETGPAFIRLFTQFIGYFNMMANTNGTALKQIYQETGLKKGFGKAAYVVIVGAVVPLLVAEAIALMFRGGPGDEDKDGEEGTVWDWAQALGLGLAKGSLAMLPGVGQVGNMLLARANDNPTDDKLNMSPSVSMIEGSGSAFFSVPKAVLGDGDKRKAVRDLASLISMVTGLPAFAAARPLGYLAGVSDDKIEPTSGLDAARGLATGTASPESKQ